MESQIPHGLQAADEPPTLAAGRTKSINITHVHQRSGAWFFWGVGGWDCALSWSKGSTRFRSVSLFTELTAPRRFPFSQFCSLKLNEWMTLPRCGPAWGSAECWPAIIYEAVCFLKLTRCCLLALVVRRITECFIQYLSKTADVTYKWYQILYVYKKYIFF